MGMLLSKPSAINKELESDGTYHNAKGLALLINYTFKGAEGERLGTDKDEKNVKEVFTDLGYYVECHSDPDSNETMSLLNGIAHREAMRHYDSLVIFISSHGHVTKDQFFQTSDRTYLDFNKVKQIFNSINCPQMQNKPIIFFPLFCRGEFVQANGDILKREVKSDWKDNKRIIHIPSGKKAAMEPYVEVPRLGHMFTVFGSPSGVLTWSNEDEGHLFISCLCQTLRRPEYKEMEIRYLMNETEKLLRSYGMPAPEIHSTTPFHKFVFKCRET